MAPKKKFQPKKTKQEKWDDAMLANVEQWNFGQAWKAIKSRYGSPSLYSDKSKIAEHNKRVDESLGNQRFSLGTGDDLLPYWKIGEMSHLSEFGFTYEEMKALRPSYPRYDLDWENYPKPIKHKNTQLADDGIPWPVNEDLGIKWTVETTNSDAVARVFNDESLKEYIKGFL